MNIGIFAYPSVANGLGVAQFIIATLLSCSYHELKGDIVSLAVFNIHTLSDTHSLYFCVILLILEINS
jgi:hypothetical protein